MPPLCATAALPQVCTLHAVRVQGKSPVPASPAHKLLGETLGSADRPSDRLDKIKELPSDGQQQQPKAQTAQEQHLLLAQVSDGLSSGSESDVSNAGGTGGSEGAGAYEGGSVDDMASLDCWKVCGSCMGAAW